MPVAMAAIEATSLRKCQHVENRGIEGWEKPYITPLNYQTHPGINNIWTFEINVPRTYVTVTSSIT